MTDQITAQLLPAMATLRGDLRDLMIGAMAAMTKPWNDMPAAEQTQLANMIDGHAAEIVTRIAVLTATLGRPCVMVTLDKLAIDERATGRFTVSKELAPSLVPFTRQIVAIMPVGTNQFMGERGPAPVMPDQRTLAMPSDTGGGYAEPATMRPGETKTIIIGETPSAVKPSAAATPKASKPAAKTKANGAAKPRVGSPFAR